MTRSTKSKLRLSVLTAIILAGTTGCTVPYLGGLAGSDCNIYILEPVPATRVAQTIIPGLISTGCLIPL